jgi:hypothetical protein
VVPAYRTADGWLERARAGLLALLRVLDEQPEMARVLVVDSIAWGPAVLERRGDVLEALAAALEDRPRREVERPRREPEPSRGEVESARREPEWSRSDAERARGEVEPPGPLPETTAENLVGASLSWIHTCLRAESGAPLVELAPSLMSMISARLPGRRSGPARAGAAADGSWGSARRSREQGADTVADPAAGTDFAAAYDSLLTSS